jgi:hypothetical protein
MATTMHYLDEAAFAVVRQDGVGALSRRALAAELGVSDSVVRRNLDDQADLAAMAATVCERRRSEAARRIPHDVDPASWVVERLVPDAAELDTEVVWLRLLMSVSDPEPAPDLADLRARFQVSSRGFADPDPAGEVLRAAPRQLATREALGPYVEEARDDRRRLAAGLVGEDDERVEEVLALADGLLLAVVTSRLDPTTARAVLHDHLRRLDPAT